MIVFVHRNGVESTSRFGAEVGAPRQPDSRHLLAGCYNRFGSSHASSPFREMLSGTHFLQKLMI